MRIDLHIHTTAYSSCSSMTPDQLMAAAADAGLDAVCITEHNRMWTFPDAEELSRRYGMPVFRGMEVTTTGGDILVFGIEEEPGDELWTPAQLKSKVDSAGGAAFAAHPFRGFLLFGMGDLFTDDAQALANPTFDHVHGLEVCNGLVTSAENEMAMKAARSLGLIQVGGSDAHKPESVGTCVTLLDQAVRDERELIAALLAGQFTIERTG